MKMVFIKMRSKTGATLAFAMAIFLVVVVLVGALFSVSMTAIKSTNSRKEEEQAYMAAYSSARLLQSEIEKKKFVETKTISGGSITYQFDGHDVSGSLENALLNIYSEAAPADASSEVTISDSGSNVGHSVTATFKKTGSNLSVSQSITKVVGGETIEIFNNTLQFTSNTKVREVWTTYTDAEGEEDIVHEKDEYETTWKLDKVVSGKA